MAVVDRSCYRLGGDRAQGFAKLPQQARFEMAQRGGRRAHALGRAHKWNSVTAAIAGKKGGSISRRRPKKSSNPTS